MMNFVAIDIETANTHPESVCAIGIAQVRDGRVDDSKLWLVCPPVQFSTFLPINTKLHGFTLSDVEHSQTFDLLWPELERLLQNQVVVAHNSESSEVRFLRSLFKHFNIIPKEFRTLCSLNVARCVFEDVKDRKLNVLANYLGIKFQHHKPDEDARVAAEVILEACRRRGKSTVDELMEDIGCRAEPFELDKLQSSVDTLQGGIDISLVWRTSSEDLVETRDVFCKETIRASCNDDKTYWRGVEVHKDKQVKVVSVAPWTITAEVTGSGKKPYLVTLNGALKGNCDCAAWMNSSLRFCKHVAATALKWEELGGPSLEISLRRSNPDDLKRKLIAKSRSDPELVVRLLDL